MNHRPYVSFLDRKTIKDWLHDKARVKGATKKQVEYLRDVKELIHDLGTNGILTYFLAVKLHMNNVSTMLVSTSNQKKLLYSVYLELKKYRVEPVWDRVFAYDISLIRKRVDFVYNMCVENIRLTDHYPFFKEIGFEKLKDINHIYSEGNETALDWLLPLMEEWEKAHPDEIKAHMDAIAPELERYTKHQEMIKEKEKAEKEARRLAKKAEDDYIKEMKRNKKLNDQREHKLEREFRHLYTDASRQRGIL